MIEINRKMMYTFWNIIWGSSYIL